MSGTHRTRVSNVLVVGSGAAGLRAAIAVHAAGREVVIVGKRLRKDAHTVLAAGGINAALGTVDPEDSWQQHFADTIVEGHYLGNPLAMNRRRIARLICDNGQRRRTRKRGLVTCSPNRCHIPRPYLVLLLETEEEEQEHDEMDTAQSV